MAELMASGITALKAYATKIVDFVYHASTFSIIVSAAGLLFLILIAFAVANGMIEHAVDVPFMHVK